MELSEFNADLKFSKEHSDIFKREYRSMINVSLSMSVKQQFLKFKSPPFTLTAQETEQKAVLLTNKRGDS
jgi:hypothetical protein